MHYIYVLYICMFICITYTCKYIFFVKLAFPSIKSPDFYWRKGGNPGTHSHFYKLSIIVHKFHKVAKHLVAMEELFFRDNYRSLSFARCITRKQDKGCIESQACAIYARVNVRRVFFSFSTLDSKENVLLSGTRSSSVGAYLKNTIVLSSAVLIALALIANDFVTQRRKRLARCFAISNERFAHSLVLSLAFRVVSRIVRIIHVDNYALIFSHVLFPDFVIPRPPVNSRRTEVIGSRRFRISLRRDTRDPCWTSSGCCTWKMWRATKVGCRLCASGNARWTFLKRFSLGRLTVLLYTFSFDTSGNCRLKIHTHNARFAFARSVIARASPVENSSDSFVRA